MILSLSRSLTKWSSVAIFWSMRGSSASIPTAHPSGGWRNRASVAIFILPPSREELERRLRSRGMDSDDEIARRLAKAREEISAYKTYDFCVVNEDVATAGREALAIVTALRCTTARRQTRVEELLASFGGKDFGGKD
jgi:guanylate kinase